VNVGRHRRRGGGGVLIVGLIVAGLAALALYVAVVR